MANLFHVSSWPLLRELKQGDSFVLNPGPQGAEGSGVYFAEEAPRYTAAEGAFHRGVAAIVKIMVGDTKGWWRTKNSKCRHRPRTWHSDGKSVQCRVKAIEDIDGHFCLVCSWDWA